jgi:RNA polymerase sigma factor (sigma-70 family)
MDQEEKDIIILCQKGDLDHFSLLYDKYVKKIYNYVFYKTSNQEISEDIVSNIFLQALKSISKFNLEKGFFSAWLYKISQNKINDYYRARKINYSLEEAWGLKADNNTEKEYQSQAEKKLLYQAIKKLKREQQEIIILRVLQDLSYKEIAQITKKSEAASKMIFKRSIEKLKKEIPLAILITFLSRL